MPLLRRGRGDEASPDFPSLGCMAPEPVGGPTEVPWHADFPAAPLGRLRVPGLFVGPQAAKCLPSSPWHLHSVGLGDSRTHDSNPTAPASGSQCCPGSGRDPLPVGPPVEAFGAKKPGLQGLMVSYFQVSEG